MRRALVVPLLAVALLCAASALAEKPRRDLVLMPKVAPGSVPIAGEYWALIIGIDKYQHAPPLDSAVKDATAVRDVLVARYGFSRRHVIELLNQQATGPNIQDALYRLTQEAGPEDSVFIYYAGHGQYDKDRRLGWWVPVEGKPQSPGTFITNAAIRDYIEGMKAKHVYLVADSCFSGTLFGKARAMPPLNDKFFATLYANKSRWGLTSGGTEPVADSGKGGHSIFAYHFLKLLKENTDSYLVPSHIIDQIAPVIANNAEQTPRSEPIRNTGDEGGQFVFRLAVGAMAKQSPAASVGSAGSAELEAERQRLKTERDAFEREKHEAEERAKLEAERRQVEEERRRLAEEKTRQGEEQRKLAELRRSATEQDVLYLKSLNAKVKDGLITETDKERLWAAYLAKVKRQAELERKKQEVIEEARVRPYEAPSIPTEDFIVGNYWAMIVGINRYKEAPPLEAAVKDATGVRDVLVQRYGFKHERIIELLDEQATRTNIESALFRLGQQAKAEDSVLIYYAGHGQYDKEGRLCWWLPVDARPQSHGMFINDTLIRDYIESMKAKHVYLVVDSCMSELLLSMTRAMPPLKVKFFARVYQNKSRWGLTSGMNEPVADAGKDGHSIFAYHFINLLKQNTDPYLIPSQIFDQIAPLIARSADQTPRTAPLRMTGDEGGQFVFRLAAGTGTQK